jgi:hypothetical protein
MKLSKEKRTTVTTKKRGTAGSGKKRGFDSNLYIGVHLGKEPHRPGSIALHCALEHSKRGASFI